MSDIVQRLRDEAEQQGYPKGELLKSAAAGIESLRSQLVEARAKAIEECRQVNIKEADACIVFARMAAGAPPETIYLHEQAAAALRKAAETMQALATTSEKRNG